MATAVSSSDLKKYLGSGVLIVDTKTSSLLLVHDYTQKYNCCGGFIKYSVDDPLRIEKTAMEELFEETRTLISCDIEHLSICPYVDLDFHDDIFRCYIFRTKCPSDICEQFERFHLNELPTDDDYHETTGLSFFPLKQFKGRKSGAKIQKTSCAKTHARESKELHRRVLSVIKAAIERKLL